MKKEKKQLRELSDEDLKKVIGGYVKFGNGDDLVQIYAPGNGCPDGLVESTDAFGTIACFPPTNVPPL